VRAPALREVIATLGRWSHRKQERALIKARERYSERYVFRAAVQLIPYIGSSLDTLLAGGAVRLQLERVEGFLDELNVRMQAFEGVSANLDDEGFSDLMLTTLDEVARTRSADKRARFAAIISRQVVEARPWDDAENAVRLLADLEDIHIEVLQVALAAPPFGGAFEGKPVVCLAPVRAYDPGETAPLRLEDALPRYDGPALRMACAELSAKGLLHDEGVGRWDIGAMNYFVATDLAHWFNQWLTTPDLA
jgi:hypothetical protein